MSAIYENISPEDEFAYLQYAEQIVGEIAESVYHDLGVYVVTQAEEAAALSVRHEAIITGLPAEVEAFLQDERLAAKYFGDHSIEDPSDIALAAAKFLWLKNAYDNQTTDNKDKLKHLRDR